MIEYCDIIRDWLEGSWHIKAPEDWLQACVEWIQSENQGEALGCDAIQQLVYEQWLLSDLTEVGAACLPPDVKQHVKTQLPGNYCLQVNSLVDVGTPFYGQLQKVEGTENENVNISATQFTQKWNEAKPSRMLMLKMTDGATDIQGMEYRPIPQLSPALTPGAKVVVNGPVLCRLGVLMLTRENVQVLGGEVDSLTETSSQVQLLKLALQENDTLRENPPELKKRIGSGNCTKRVPSEQQSTSQRRAPFQQQQPRNVPSSSFKPKEPPPIELSDDDDFLKGIDTEHLNQLEQQWDDDVDYAGALDTVEQGSVSSSVQPPRQPSQISQQPHMSSNIPSYGQQQDGGLSQNKSQVPQRAGLVSAQSSFDQHSRESVCSRGVRSTNSNAQQSLNRGNGFQQLSNVPPQGNKLTTIDDRFADVPDFNDDFEDIDMDVMMEHMEFQDKMTQEPTNNTVPQATQRQLPTIKTDSQVLPSHPQTSLPQPSKTPKRVSFGGGSSHSQNQGVQQKQTHIESFLAKSKVKDEKQTKPAIRQQTLHQSFAQSSASAARHGAGPSASFKAEHLKDDGFDCELTSFNPPRAKKLRPSNSPESSHNVLVQDSESDIIITEVKEARRSSSGHCDIESKPAVGRGWDSPPFRYIADIKNLKPAETSTYIFKAYIVTLLSKLEYNEGRHWSLQVKINDGSATLDVDLGDEMLSELIGFSAHRCLQVKAGGQADKQTKVALAKGLKRCQQQLVKMSVMMQVQLGGQRSQPYVSKIWTPTLDDLENLKKRVLSNR